MLEAGVVENLKLNDKDYGIYSLFWCIKHTPETLIERIATFTPTHKEFFKAQQLIKTDYRYLDMIDAAWITLMVNRLAFSGIAKANPLGGRNGKQIDLVKRWNPTTLIKRIKKIHEMADSFEIYCEDAVSFIEDWLWDDEMTAFIDPPYYSKGKLLYNQFYTEEDHVKLAWVLRTIYWGFPSADIIVTYDFNKFIDDLYFAADKREVIGRNYSI